MKSSSKSFTSLFLLLTYFVLTLSINPYLFSQIKKSINSLYEIFLEFKKSSVSKHSNFSSYNKCSFETVSVKVKKLSLTD